MVQQYLSCSPFCFKKKLDVFFRCIFFLKVREVCWCRVCNAHNIKEVEIFGVVKIINSKAIYFDILVIVGYVNHMSFMCFIMYAMH